MRLDALRSLGGLGDATHIRVMGLKSRRSGRDDDEHSALQMKGGCAESYPDLREEGNNCRVKHCSSRYVGEVSRRTMVRRWFEAM